MDPRSSLTETKLSLKEFSLPAEMPLVNSVGAANQQSPPPRFFEICGFVPQEHHD